MRGLSEHGRKLGMQRNGERPMDSASEEKVLHLGRINSSAENSGMRQALKTDLL